jgi:hypothetical protein
MSLISNDIQASGVMKIRIEAVGGDLDRVVCRYPASFMNEMASQLTVAIESATGVNGIADSSVELVMVFAPNTYMEHISGNVTYRRLMLIDAVSAPRDFWVKWTRLEAVEGEYTAENILFELGEDVDQKIREKEYRYLLGSGKEKYHNSMGRKKVTEWREVIKRAVKRGELGKVENDLELAPETLELEARIADLLGKKIEQRSSAVEEAPVIENEQPESEDYVRALEKARAVVDGDDEDDELTLEEIAEEISADEPAEEFLQETLELSLEFDEESSASFDEADEVDEFEGDEASEFDFEEDSDVTEDTNEIIEEAEHEELEVETDIFEDDEPEDEEEIDIFADGEEISDGEPDVETVAESEELKLQQDDEEAEEFVIEETEEFVIEETEEFVIEEAEEEPEVEEEPEASLPEMEIEIYEEATVDVVEVESEENEEISEDVAAEPENDEPSNEEADAIIDANIERLKVDSPTIAERVAEIRAQIETKIRLEYEIRAREKAEAELIKLRHQLQQLHTESELAIAELKSENERLRTEYDRLLEQVESERFTREADEARRRLEEIELREQIETQLRAEAAERERLAENARMAIEEQHRLEMENARIAREREDAERIEAERIRIEEHERELEAIRQAEIDRIAREREEAMERARNAMPDMGDGKPYFTSKTVKLLFRKSVDPNITTRIQQLIKSTVDYYGKEGVYLRIKATIPDTQTVVLEFAHVPIEEMPLLGNIIKVLGNSGLGIAKAIIE